MTAGRWLALSLVLAILAVGGVAAAGALESARVGHAAAQAERASERAVQIEGARVLRERMSRKYRAWVFGLHAGDLDESRIASGQFQDALERLRRDADGSVERDRLARIASIGAERDDRAERLVVEVGRGADRDAVLQWIDREIEPRNETLDGELARLSRDSLAATRSAQTVLAASQRRASVALLAATILALIVVLALGLGLRRTMNALYGRAALAEQRAARERDRFFEIAVDLFCIADNAGFFRRISPSFTTTLGWSEGDLLGAPYLDFVHPDDRERTLAEAATLAQGANTVLFRNRYRCSDGSYRVLSWRSIPDRETGLLYAVARDVTREDELQKDVVRNSRMASLGALALRVAHEINNPLSWMMTNVEWLAGEGRQRKADDPLVAEAWADTRAGAERIKCAVNAILAGAYASPDRDPTRESLSELMRGRSLPPSPG